MTTKAEKEARYYDRAVACLNRMPTVHRDALMRVLKLRRNRGLRANSHTTWATSLARIVAWAGDRPLRRLSPENWSDCVAHLRDLYAPHTVYTTCGFAKATLRDLYEPKDVPRAIKRALSIREEKRRPKGCIITADQFAALLEAAANYQAHGYSRLQRFELVTMLHVLRDSGFRASEALALRNGSVTFEGDHGAYLDLPEDAADLKTGPRRIGVAGCVPALKAWMAIHPAAGDPTAPLFPGVRCRDGTKPFHYAQLANVMAALGGASGINKARATGESLTCHDFRHTRATEAARANWHPTKMEAYFGWAPGSKMAARYAHLADADLLDQVLNDAGVNTTGKAATVDVGMKTCPTCAEDIKAAALKCRYCGERLDTVTRKV